MTSPLYVRLTTEQAGRLDQAAAAVPAHKKDLIGGLVDRYVDPSTPAGVDALRELATAKRVTVELGGEAPVVGHAEFRPNPPAEVLDAAGAAELLAVEKGAVIELAEAGGLPGRQIGGQWRFSRQALLDWLAAT